MSKGCGNRMNKKGKHILLLFTYIVLTATLYFLQDINKGFFISAVAFFLLIFVRVLIWYALKPIGFIHGNPIKYRCQKRGKLKEYKAVLEKIEIILVGLGSVCLIIGIISALLNGGFIC